MLLAVKRLVALAAVGLLACACAAQTPTPAPTEPSGANNPLAIAPGFNGDLARNEGMLEVGAECVYLRNNGDRWLLVWPAGHVGWDAATRTISYVNSDGATRDFRDGQRVAVGGSGGGFGEGPMLNQLQIDWVLPPAESCDARSHWWLGDLVPL